MYFVYPSYYQDFFCSADKCRHSCCKGWEICIDDNSSEKYLSEKGPLGKKLLASMVKDEYGYSFALLKNGDCPFLLNNGLCELICKKGEEYICDICKEHPRFVNSYDNRVETGLGLACETAAELILSYKDTVRFESIDLEEPENNSEYSNVLQAEYKMIDIFQNRSINFKDRINEVTNYYNLNFNNFKTDDTVKLLKSLEKLSDEREVCIDLLRKSNYLHFENNFDIPLEQLSVYLTYRHVPQSAFDNRLYEHIAFVIFSIYVISTSFFNSDNKSMENFIDICRIFSSEIEYSDYNVSAILDYFNI